MTLEVLALHNSEGWSKGRCSWPHVLVALLLLYSKIERRVNFATRFFNAIAKHTRRMSQAGHFWATAKHETGKLCMCRLALLKYNAVRYTMATCRISMAYGVDIFQIPNI